MDIRRSVIRGYAGGLFIALLLFAVFMFLRGRSRQHVGRIADVTPSRPSAARQDPVAWPDIPYPPPVYGALPESIPEMRRLDINVEAACLPPFPTPDTLRLRERVAILVQRNVVTQVATELDRLLMDGTIRLSLSPYLKNSAAIFTVMNGHAVMVVNAKIVAALDGPRDVVKYMLTLGHELIHYRQWRRSTDPFEQELFTRGGQRTIEPRACPILWRIEREAYHWQCEMGNGFGLKLFSDIPERDYCIRILDDRAFDQAFYRSEAALASEPVRRTCGGIWRQLADGSSP